MRCQVAKYDPAVGGPNLNLRGFLNTVSDCVGMRYGLDVIIYSVLHHGQEGNPLLNRCISSIQDFDF